MEQVAVRITCHRYEDGPCGRYWRTDVSELQDAGDRIVARRLQVPVAAVPSVRAFYGLTSNSSKRPKASVAGTGSGSAAGNVIGLACSSEQGSLTALARMHQSLGEGSAYEVMLAWWGATSHILSVSEVRAFSGCSRATAYRWIARVKQVAAALAHLRPPRDR